VRPSSSQRGRLKVAPLPGRQLGKPWRFKKASRSGLRRGLYRGQGGMTLAEVLVAMAIMSVAIGLLLAFLYDFFDLLRSTSAQVTARQRRNLLILALRKDVKAAEAVLDKLASFETGEGSLILGLPAGLENETTARYVVYRQKETEVERTEFDAEMRVLNSRIFALGPGLVKMKFHLAPPPMEFFVSSRPADREEKGKVHRLLWSEISFRKAGERGPVTSLKFCLLPGGYLCEAAQ